MPYDECIGRTIQLFYLGKDAVMRHLDEFLQDRDVLERIENCTIDFKNFFYWGSLSYII
ncbi:hypothetical protein QE382_002851 [Sphingobacterium zeae]|uniref:Uncharacterized protein n=1 Tax=Sphingobacterium zeae TaxID=1776859 RepID=A0ABU0U7D7_9SPHI|nr:hypothetical protein [Sphingobacterium zeae]